MKRVMLVLLALSLLSIPVLAQAKGEPGAVYAMTNAENGNEVVAYNRDANGMLTLAGIFPTGGNGKTTEIRDALGAQNPLILSPDNRWLLTVNAGSNSISVFQVNSDNSLMLVDLVSSGGEFPVSLTLFQNMLYVLNTGGDGNITGFTLGNNGHLSPLVGSTRSLNTGGLNPPDFLESPAQVGFSPLGDKLVVTVKGAKTDMAKILIFTVKPNGLPSMNPFTNADLPVPFGFVFDDLNNLIVVEPFGDAGLPPGNTGAVSAYQIRESGELVPISSTVTNHQIATCWIAISTNTHFAYTTNNGNGTISSYKVNADGSLSVIQEIAAALGADAAPVDLAITPNNQYLYNVNAGHGTVSMFKINQSNGYLVPLGEIGGLPDTGTAVGIAVR